MLSSSNKIEAYSLYYKARERMLEGEFSLRKLKTNDCELRHMIMKNERVESTLVAETHKEEESFAKEILGPVQQGYLRT